MPIGEAARVDLDTLLHTHTSRTVINCNKSCFVGMLPAYSKVRRTHYLARLGGWPVVWGRGKEGGSLRRGSVRELGAGGNILG